VLQSLFSELANASNFIRLTCLNALFALLALAAHSSMPWRQGAAQSLVSTGADHMLPSACCSVARPPCVSHTLHTVRACVLRIIAGGDFGNRSGSSLLLDAPWYAFWPEMLIWVVLEASIATMFAVGHVSTSAVRPFALESSWYENTNDQHGTGVGVSVQHADRAEATNRPRCGCCVALL
jgi:hypothetical protein